MNEFHELNAIGSRKVLMYIHILEKVLHNTLSKRAN